MTATTQCFAPFQAQVLRATRLDACGVPVIGSKSTLVTDGLMSVELKAQWDSGTEVIVKNARGRLKVSNPPQPVLKYYDVTITLTDVDPDLYEMATGQQLIVDGHGNPIGVGIDEFVANTFGLGLETWTLAGTDAGSCGPAGELYGYFLAPQIVNGAVGDMKLDDGAMSCVITGRTKRGSGWGHGPYDVMDVATTGSTVTAGPLITAIGPARHLEMFETPVAPPAAACGAVALAA